MTCGDVRSRVEIKIVKVKNRIEELEKIKEALLRLVKKCTGRGPIGQCPFIKELETITKGEITE